MKFVLNYFQVYSWSDSYTFVMHTFIGKSYAVLMIIIIIIVFVLRCAFYAFVVFYFPTNWYFRIII